MNGLGAQRSAHRGGRVVALCGGIGGAKLALGLQEVIGDERLLVVVNTGDDFDHLGLHVSPDIDTVIYTLAGLANPDTGWGRAGETWNFMTSLAQLGGETWFQLGDKDLAMHVERTRRLRAGESLSAITDDIRRRLGIAVRVLPMSDDPLRTMVDTEEGLLPFQRYFVERKCEPRLKAVLFQGAQEARPLGEVLSTLAAPDLRAVILCPSNPYLSTAPILALPGMNEALRATSAPVLAVTPIISGGAVKGPTAKIMTELGLQVSPVSVARHYAKLIDGFVLDVRDHDVAPEIRMPVAIEQTLMSSLKDKIELARSVLNFADSLAMGGMNDRERIA